MALTYPTFAELDSTRYSQILELLTSVIQAYNPDIDLRRGVVSDLALAPRSLLAETTEQAVLTALDNTSLSLMTANPATADTDSVDRVVGNLRLTRQPAVAATGQISIVLSKNVVTVISAGTVFTIGSQSYVADNTYTGRTSSGDVVLPTDKLITAVGSNYTFTIGIKASTAGAAGNASVGSTAIPSVTPYSFVRAYAYTAISGGVDAQSNASLLSQAASGLAPKAWSSRPSIEAACRTQIPGLLNVSVIGHGDTEMLREQHSLWPVAGGGRADLYTRTSELYTTIRLTKTATLVSKIGTVGTWQFGIAKADAPGFYEVKSVSLPSTLAAPPSFSVTSDVRSVDLTGLSAPPDVVGALEGTYSSLQAAVIQFSDTTTDATSLAVNVATAPYEVILKYLPGIDTLQAYWLGFEVAPTSGDVLVKAPVPCFTTLAFTLNVPAGTSVDTVAVASELASAINDLDFPGTLALSYVSTVLHGLVPALTSVTSYTASGRIRACDGSTVNISGGDLVIPNSPSIMVTSRTTGFFVDPANVTITVA